MSVSVPLNFAAMRSLDEMKLKLMLRRYLPTCNYFWKIYFGNINFIYKYNVFQFYQSQF